MRSAFTILHGPSPSAACSCRIRRTSRRSAHHADRRRRHRQGERRPRDSTQSSTRPDPARSLPTAPTPTSHSATAISSSRATCRRAGSRCRCGTRPRSAPAATANRHRCSGAGTRRCSRWLRGRTSWTRSSPTSTATTRASRRIPSSSRSAGAAPLPWLWNYTTPRMTRMDADRSVRRSSSERDARRSAWTVVEQQQSGLDACRLLSPNAHGAIRVHPRHPR